LRKSISWRRCVSMRNPVKECCTLSLRRSHRQGVAPRLRSGPRDRVLLHRTITLSTSFDGHSKTRHIVARGHVGYRPGHRRCEPHERPPFRGAGGAASRAQPCPATEIQ
jgi:hypothetical protein